MQERQQKRFSRDEVGVGQCKQCGGPVTDLDQIAGPTGIFCSERCRDQYEAFNRRVADMEEHGGKARGRLLFTLKVLYKRLVVVLIILIALGAVAYFLDLPIAGPFVRDLLGRFGR